MLQSADGDDWVDLYGFVPAAGPADRCLDQQLVHVTYPRSPFVTGLVVSMQRPDGTRESLSDWNHSLSLTVETPAGAAVTEVDAEAVPELIAARFGLEATLV